MKKIFFLLAILSLFLCGFSNPREVKTVKLTGRVMYVGNEPFACLAFVPYDTDEIYAIEDEKTVKVLKNHQGVPMEVKGEFCESKNPNTKKGLKIKKWKLVNTED